MRGPVHTAASVWGEPGQRGWTDACTVTRESFRWGGGCTLLLMHAHTLHPHAAHATLPSLALHCTPLSHPQQRQHPPAPLRNPHTQWRLRVWRLYNTCNVQVSPAPVSVAPQLAETSLNLFTAAAR